MRLRCDDGVRALPQALVVEYPGALCVTQAFERVCFHAGRVACAVPVSQARHAGGRRGGVLIALRQRR